MINKDEGKGLPEETAFGGHYNRTGEDVLDNHISSLDMELEKAQANLFKLQELKDRLEDARQINLERAIHEQEREALLKLKDENIYLKDSVLELKKSLAEGMQLFQSRIMDSLDAIENKAVSSTPKFNISKDEIDERDAFFGEHDQTVDLANNKPAFSSFFEEDDKPEPAKKIEPVKTIDAKTEPAIETEPEEKKESFFEQKGSEVEEKRESFLSSHIDTKEPEKESFLDSIEEKAIQKEADPDALDFENRISAIREKISQIEDGSYIAKTDIAPAKEKEVKEAKKAEDETAPKKGFLAARKAKKEALLAAKREARIKRLEAEKRKEEEEEKARLAIKEAKEKARQAKIDAKKQIKASKKSKPEKDDEPSLAKLKPSNSVGKTMFRMAVVIFLVFCAGLGYQVYNADKTRNTYIEQTKTVLANSPVGNQTPNGQEEDPTKKYASAYFDVPYDGTVWDTFTDNYEMKVAVDYPTNTTYKLKKPGSPNVWFLRRDAYLFKIDETESDLSLKDYITSQKLSLNYTQEETTYRGKPAIHMVLQDKIEVMGNMYYVKIGDRIYRVWYKTFEPNQDVADAQRVKKMLDSVKFLYVPPTAETTSTKKSTSTATPVQEQNPSATKPSVTQTPATGQ